MTKKAVGLLQYEGSLIHRDRSNCVSLTDMWKAAGCPMSKAPAAWIRQDATQGLVKALGLNMRQEHVYRSKPGRNGGAWGIPKLAIAYAEYLSPKFHAWALGAIIERMEEEADPGLAAERGLDRSREGYKRIGWDNAKIHARHQGIVVRNDLTSALQEHGVAGNGYGQCTNAIYKPLFGGTAPQIRKTRGLKPKANLRDNMSSVELCSVALSESLAREKIVLEDLSGNKQCADACDQSASAVSLAVRRIQGPRQTKFITKK